MADAVEPTGSVIEGEAEVQRAQEAVVPVAVAVSDAGEQIIGRVLRFGALLSGGLFLLSVVLEAAQPAWAGAERLGLLRGGAASILVVAPIVRLLVSGISLGMNREWRYAGAAAAVLVLLALGMGLGWSH